MPLALNAENRQLGLSRWQQGHCADAAIVFVDRQRLAASGRSLNKHRYKGETAKPLCA